MSEIINNKQMRIETMKNLIRQLHSGSDEETIKEQLGRILQSVEYSDVFIMENQLIEEGIPAESIRKLCDVHTRVLRQHLDLQLPVETIEGHPIHTLRQENKEIQKRVDEARAMISRMQDIKESDIPSFMNKLHRIFNDLMDIEKHYSKKENLIFPYFEKKNFTGPSKVMWGKDDEVREFLRNVLDVLNSDEQLNKEELTFFINQAVIPALDAISEMIYKEEKIFLPMAKELLTEQEWYEVYLQTDEIGYCLYVPTSEWQPEGGKHEIISEVTKLPGKIKLPTGSFTVEELMSVFNTMPFDLTFVDKEDTVRFFSEGPDRIFTRTKAILGRKVQNCHPPDSVHIVNQILSDFKEGRQDRARFWINFRGRFVYIVYYALRDELGNYLGTLEVTQDLTELRELQGERRLLSYDN